MKTAGIILSCLMCSVVALGQAPLDSMIEHLQDKDLSLLNTQLDRIQRHGLLQKIQPDRSQWPALRETIVARIKVKSENFNMAAQAEICAFLAEMLVRERQVTAGYLLIKEAFKKSENLPPIRLAYLYVKFADIFKHLSRLDSAIVYAEKVVDIARIINSDSLGKVSLDQVSILCYRSKNYPKAEFYFKKLVTHPLTTPTQQRDYYNTIALTFRNRLMYDSALEYFSRGLKIAEGLPDKVWVGLIEGNIGYVYFLEKRYKEAIPPLLKDIEFSFKGHNDESGLKALSTVTSIYVAWGDKVHAKFYYDSLLHGSSHFVDPNIRVEFFKTSADYFGMTGDLKKTNAFLRLYSDLADSLRDLANVERASQLESQFEFDRQVGRIELLERESLAYAAGNRQKNYLLIGASIIALLATILLYVVYRNNRFKQITNHILQEQNARITEQAGHLNHLNATKDKLFSIISHDLRGPINSLKALMGMVRKDMITQEEFMHFSAQLQNNVEYVHFTLENLLYWSRSQLLGINARPQPTVLTELVTEGFNLLSEQIKVKNIQVSNHLSPDRAVMADTNQIRLVFRNLISNAIKFTEAGGQIDISSVSKGENEIISVKDTGGGIPADLIAKLFDPSTTTAGTSGEKGTGLGLALCKEMVEKNNGKIWVESTPGQGAVFKFSLPRIQ